MSRRIEELDWVPTPMGDLMLRRRRDPTTGAEVYEVKLGEEFLMSSMFTAAEIALAELGLAEAEGEALDVVVGGLGLGYTAQAALTDPRVASLLVVERLGPVIDWHRRGLVPVGPALTADPRCRFVSGDFFALSAGRGFDPDAMDRRVDVVLLDVDHSPRHVLHPSHTGFYEEPGLRQLADHLRPGGIFALWSNDPPDEEFLGRLRAVFDGVRAQVVTFDNPLQERTSANTVYLARRP